MLNAGAQLLNRVRESRPRLEAISEERAGISSRAGAWTPKQILGHLIDSAANNHQRFVRLRFASRLTFPGYDQEQWVDAGDWNGRPWAAITELWCAYNLQLAHLLNGTPGSALSHVWMTDDGAELTLDFISRDYLRHLDHHLDQILAAGHAS